MHEYHIYLIKDMIARHYFGRQRLLFQLFNDYRSLSDNHLKNVFKKQIRYISQPVDKERLNRLIYRLLQNNDEYRLIEGRHYLRRGQNEGTASLAVGVHETIIRSDGNGEQEVAFFEILRQIDSRFLAIDFDRRRCAWLNPVKDAEFLRSKVDLVSRDSVN